MVPGTISGFVWLCRLTIKLLCCRSCYAHIQFSMKGWCWWADHKGISLLAVSITWSSGVTIKLIFSMNLLIKFRSWKWLTISRKICHFISCIMCLWTTIITWLCKCKTIRSVISCKELVRTTADITTINTIAADKFIGSVIQRSLSSINSTSSVWADWRQCSGWLWTV